MAAAKVVYECRERAGALFGCEPEQVVFTSNCTHGLNIAIRTLVKPGGRVVISGFEHNAVTRPLHGLGARITVAGRVLFDPADTLSRFEDALKQGVDAAVFTHASNVFGYILPVEELAELCRQYGVPVIVDAAQTAGTQQVNLEKWGASFVAMPGHKGLLGPQGTGLLLCGMDGVPLLYGGTGSESVRQDMPDYLPDRLEAGTVNVPGIAGVKAGLEYLQKTGTANIGRREAQQAARCANALKNMGMLVFSGENQGGTVSFVPKIDCEEMAQMLAQHGIAVRAGLHCAPLAHESAGTMKTGTVRISFGYDASSVQTDRLLHTLAQVNQVQM
jgi:selenocysteine lyase/cysteine desulfurase